MLICNSCGRVVSEEDLDYSYEKYPYGDTHVSEKVMDYDCSCGGQFEEAVMCDMCDKKKTKDDVFGYEHNVCLNCIDEHLHYGTLKEITDREGSRRPIDINLFLSYVYSTKDIEEMLWDNIYKCVENGYKTPLLDKISKAMTDWKNNDLDSSADAIYEEYRIGKEKE